MVVVDGQQAGDQRIETQQEQAAGGSSGRGGQRGEASRGAASRVGDQGGGSPLLKTKQNQNFVNYITSLTLKF